MCCCRKERGKRTACIVEPNFRGAKCIHIKRETHRKTTQHLIQQQQLCCYNSDPSTCAEGCWLYYYCKCSQKQQAVQRKITPPPLQGLRLHPWLQCFLLLVWVPFERNWQRRRFKATMDHIFVTALITAAGWLEHPFRGDHLDLHVLLPPGEILLADEKKQLPNQSEVYALT